MTELICITCPKGCHLRVDEEKGFAVTGNRCPRGADISFGNRLTALYFTAFSSKRNLKIPQIVQIAHAVFVYIILHCFSCHNIHMLDR